MRRALASVVGGFAVLAMLVAVGCSESPTAPGAEAVIPYGSVSGATVGSEGTVNNSAPPHSMAALVFRGQEGCGVVDGNGDWFPEGWPDEFATCGTEVATHSNNGNASLRVRLTGVPNDTGRAVNWDPYNPGQAWADSYDIPDYMGPPYPCVLLGADSDINDPSTWIYTVNWHATVSASGVATLTCIYSAKSEFQFPQ